jgi:hypothetical protein
MVSSRVAAELRECYERLQAQSVNVNVYEGFRRDVAFDLATVDAFVAGIISRILDRDTISEQEKLILRRAFLTGQTWNGHEVPEAKLGEIPEMLNYARTIELARVLCLKAVGG